MTDSEILRAARWSRVSSRQQARSDREGLPYQIDAQNRALALLEAADTGIAWQVTHSGGDVHTTAEWADMLGRAGRDFDLLVVAYVSRLGRNAEEQLRAVRLIGETGAAVYFAEERIDTRDEAQWEAMAREIVEAESYRRRLSRTMKRTYDSRHRRRGLPGGRPPLGYVSDWSIDPIAAQKVRNLFTEYATGSVSIENLAAAHGLEPEALKETLRNRTYMGLAIQNGEELPGAFEPIITPALFDQVARIRHERTRAGGARPKRHSMLARRFWCACGTPIRLDGQDGQHQWRTRHPEPCDLWGAHERKRAIVFEYPLRQALLNIRLTDATIERMVATAQGRRATPPPVSTLDTARARKRLRDAYDAGTIDAAAYIAQDAALKASTPTPATPASPASPDILRETLYHFRDALVHVSQTRHGDEVWANVAARYIQRIEYLGPGHLGIVPTAEGQVAITPGTMPEKVALARPEGSNPQHTTLTVLSAPADGALRIPLLDPKVAAR